MSSNENDILDPSNNKRESPNEFRSEAQDMVLVQKNAGLLRKIFPDEQQREYAKSQLAIVKTELEFRRRALEVARNGQLEVMRKQVNAWASVQGVHTDKEKERAIRDLITLREHEVNKSIDDFLIGYQGAVERSDSMPEGKVKELEMKRLDRVLTDFYDRIDFFNNEFKNSLEFSS